MDPYISSVRTRADGVLARRRNSDQRRERRGSVGRFNRLFMVMTLLAALLMRTDLNVATAVVGPVGQGFTVTPADLAFILKQIKIAERHAATLTPLNPCGTLVGPGPDQIPDALTSYGLRTVDGSCNNLIVGREKFAAADVAFPRLTTPVFRPAEARPAGLFAPTVGSPTTYASKKGSVYDTQPRMISNLIVDQTSTNPAAVAAAGKPVRTQNALGLFPCAVDPLANPPADVVPATPPGCTPGYHTLFIPNVTTDVGLSPPYNSLFTFFGQFFDHGVDQTVKSGGSVFVPLRADDPLIAGPDHIFGNADDLDPNLRFMVLTRGQQQPGPDGMLVDVAPSTTGVLCTTPNVANVPAGCDETADNIQDANNTDTPWVDNSQTYTSHSSHQVFLREYAMNSLGHPVSTGKLLGPLPGAIVVGQPGADADGAATTGAISTWASTKEQAATKLGLLLQDKDVTNIPMLAADPYGKFIPGPRGLPQFVTASGLVEGCLATDVTCAGPVPVPTNVRYFDTPFLTDIAHNADPSCGRSGCPTPDADNVANANFAAQPAGTYDNEMLDAHFTCGDGRCNENIALSTIHTVFHHEHDRLIDDIKNVLLHDLSSTGVAALQDWKLPVAQSPDGWNGERLFQAARFINEMEYQHTVFEEFARKMVPAVRPFHVYSPDINPAIPAEFAHAVYRFGHSMLNEDVARTTVDPTTGVHSDHSTPLLHAFLNPPELFNPEGSCDVLPCTPGDVPLSPEAGAGAVIMGASDQVGNELDEFITETLRNNLLGLPLDLATLNMTRARSEGVPPLNEVRRQIFARTNDGQLTPYTSWADFGQHLKHPESLINFVAAYGTHPSITSVSTLVEKRNAARAIVNPILGDVAPPDAAAFMFSTSYPGVAAVAAVPGVSEVASGPGPDGIIGTDCGLPTASPECADNPPPVTPAIQPIPAVVGIPAADWSSDANGVTTTGLDSVDLWVGGLAEVTNLFGSLLGSTFNYVFQTTLENLQDGDRLYYLARTPGLELRSQLEGNSFAELIQRNTDGTNSLKADSFATADCRFQLAHLAGTPAGFAQFGSAVADDLTTTDCNESKLLLRQPNGTIQYRQFNTVNPSGINGQAVYNGTPGNDRIFGGNDNDTVWGGPGNDVIEGNGGDDVLLGGDGNDIITDSNGADVLKGGPGNDAIDAGPGNDIILGGDGSDFTNGGAGDNETFAGPGNDFIIAGQGADAVFGGGGDDWIEGGTGQDLLQGDHGAPFFDDPGQTAPGNDIFIGQPGENDYDGEGGDDLMAQNPGIDRNAGAAGFDWAFHQYDTVPADDDMNINNNLIGLPIQVVVNRDRWQEVEADSGGPFDDIIRGGIRVPSTVGGAGFAGCDAIDAAGVARIAGLNALIKTFPTPVESIVAKSAAHYCPLNGGSGTGFAWGEGDVLIGGPGSDLIEGRAANDIIDGDRYLHVRISVRNAASPGTELGTTDLMENKATSGNFGPGTTNMTLQQAVFAGLVDPAQLVATREIITPVVPAPDCGSVAPKNCDTALYSGPASNYFVSSNADGSVNVTEKSTVVGGAALRTTDGTDTLWNIENLRFCEVTDPLTKLCSTFSNQLLGPIAVADQASLAFGNQVVNTASAVQTIRVSNIGNLDLVFSGVTVTGPDSASFNAITDCTVMSPFNGTCGVVVSFNPSTIGAKSATINIASNALGSPLTIFVTGTGIITAPVLSKSTTSLSFGSQVLNTTSSSQIITLTNTGNAALIISGISVTGTNAALFASSSVCGTIAPGGGCTIGVTFSPTTTGAKSATLTITSNDAASPTTVALTGNGMLAPTTATMSSIAFGRVAVRTTVTRTVTVSNVATRPLFITAATTNAPFSVTLGTCAIQVRPGRTCKLNVTFAPTTVGPASATLALVSNASNNPTSTLSGTGR